MTHPLLLFTFNGIFDRLKKLKLKRNTPPNGVPYFILKKCAYLLAVPLVKIINFTCLKGVVPLYWKQAHIVPKFKKRDKPANYRPILLN